MVKKTGIALFAVIVLISGVSFSAEAEEVLTLEKALSIARTNNPRVLEACKMIDASKGELITARALPNPEAEFEIAGLRENEEGERDVRLGSFEIIQGFEPLGTYGLKTRIAKNEVSARGESLKSVWATVYAEVRETYTRIILDKKRLELATGNLEVYRRFYSQVELRYQSGKALKNELQRSKIELLRSENAYNIAEKEVKADKAALNLLLGRTMDYVFSIDEELKEEALKISLSEATGIASSMSPDIKAEKIRLDSEARNLTKEQLSRLPSPYIGFKNVNESYDKDYNLIIGATVPLWDLNQGQVQKARAQKEAQSTRLDAAKRMVAFNVYQAYLDVELSQKQLELLKKSLEEANELLRIADLSYSEGGIDFINFLDQVKTATETRIRYYEGLFGLSTAISQLEKVMYSSLRKEGYLQ
ncbi:MAG: TolC family protein [Candidatus Omnitrophica bacterium]|nr:TolC family protein [Candidatus Omnitrophota bacterium]